MELAGDFRVFRHSVRPNSCDVCLHELSYLGLHHFSFLNLFFRSECWAGTAANQTSSRTRK